MDYPGTVVHGCEKHHYQQCCERDNITVHHGFGDGQCGYELTVNTVAIGLQTTEWIVSSFEYITANLSEARSETDAACGMIG